MNIDLCFKGPNLSYVQTYVLCDKPSNREFYIEYYRSRGVQKPSYTTYVQEIGPKQVCMRPGTVSASSEKFCRWAEPYGPQGLYAYGP